MEGPGVKVISERLKFLEGATITSIVGNSKKVNKDEFPGKTIELVFSHGKNLIIKVEKVGNLRVHFLMYGSFSINKVIKNEKYLRLGIKTTRGDVYFYNCAVDLHKDLPFRGQDILLENYDEEESLQRLKSFRGLICDALLDQDLFPGVGNIIKVEALFRSRIHPESETNRIPEDKLRELIRKTREFSYIFYDFRKKGYSLKENLTIYAKKYCIFCGSHVKRKKTGTKNRISYFCETCQYKY
ncbi:MAG: DNA-formamidopyrimidine glycosylase family protein [Candidatus Hydrothermia bacterium]